MGVGRAVGDEICVSVCVEFVRECASQLDNG